MLGNVGISYNRNGYGRIWLGRVVSGLYSFTGHVGFRSECEFVILSKLRMSEIQGNAKSGMSGVQDVGGYRIGGSVLHRGKDVASTYRLCPRSRTGCP